MIPVKLTIQGLYSYQERQTIDFGKLKGAKLFGIFGAVGSGKSSVLEAITFALYGKTDRLNLSGDNRNYNMMNLKSAEMLIDFEFETGKDQTAYRAIVKGKRNSKKFEDVKTLERTALRYENKTWTPVEPETLEKAIGLSYDNFKRTIIIPQGQFQEFLQLGNKDRTQMMKELFGLEKFELYGKTVALENANIEKIQNLQGQLLQLGETEPGKIEKLETTLKQLAEELENLGKSVESGQQSVSAWLQIKELSEKLEAAGKTFAQLVEKEPEINLLEKQLQQYEHCVFSFKSDIEAWKASGNRAAIKSAQIKTDETKLADIQKQIQEIQTKINGLKPDFEKRETFRQKATELGKVVQIKLLKSQVETLTERLKNGEAKTAEEIKKCENLELEKESIEQSIKEERQKLPDFELLAKVRNWHQEKVLLEKQVLENKENAGKTSEEIQTIKNKIEAEQQNQLLAKLPKPAGIDESIGFIKNRLTELKTENEKLTHEFTQLKINLKLEEFAGNLEEGNPCPLCGAVHHPQKYSASGTEKALENIQKQLNTIEKESENLSQIIQVFSDFGKHLELLEKQLSEFRIKESLLLKQIEEHNLRFQWKGFETAESVELAFSGARQLQENIRIREEKLVNISKELKESQILVEKYRNALNNLKEEKNTAATTALTLENQLQLIDSNQYENTGTEAIINEISALKQKADEVEKQFNSLTEKMNQLQVDFGKTEGTLENNRADLKKEKDETARLQLRITEKLASSDFESVEKVEEVITQNLDTEKLRKEITTFRQNVLSTRTNIQNIHNELGDRNYDAEKHRETEAELAKNKELQNQKNQEKGKLNEQLVQLKSNIETRLLLTAQLEQLQLRAENLRTMKSLFKASGFVNYISSVYLQNLCNAANDRFFKLTRQKLSLEITEDNNFQVRDFMNGGKVRSVKTLSGGQTFQAALSLALALADNIQKITESNQNFFFLDEGFGSLDKESLSIVFDTLKSLRHENRIVGVISHVEEMQQEIEVHLRVINSDETGSRIVESWAG
ncbi:MAG: SbcC/MukB-like Walker B domain-containing protein [Draconibacterium sp.]